MSRARALSRILFDRRREIRSETEDSSEELGLIRAGESELFALLENLGAAQAAAIRERETRRTVLDLVPVALVFVDRHGSICDANRAAKDLFGEQLLGCLFVDALAFDDSPRVSFAEDEDVELRDLGFACTRQQRAVRVTSHPLRDGTDRRLLVVLPAETPRSQTTDDPIRPLRRACFLAGLRILIVEDHPDVRGMLVALLAENGAKVFVATHGTEALRLLDECAPDVIISDIVLPGMDGYSFIRYARARGCVTPALAFTKLGSGLDAAHARDAGFDAHLPKPAEPTALVARIRELAHPRRSPELAGWEERARLSRAG